MECSLSFISGPISYFGLAIIRGVEPQSSGRQPDIMSVIRYDRVWWTQQDLNPYTRIKGPVCFRCTIDPYVFGGQCWCRSNLHGASNRRFHRISLPPAGLDSEDKGVPAVRKEVL